MWTFLLGADRVLTGDRLTANRDGPWRAAALPALYVLVFGMIYGGVMGSFGGWEDGRGWQVVFSSFKVPLLILATFVLGLPSYFVINTLAGLRGDFALAVHALAAAQAGVAIALAALAPLTAMWYLSSGDYNQAILYNGAMFAAAGVAGQLLLRVHYKPLIERDPRHRWLLWSWLFVYAFVGIQMGWMFRPFVGELGMPVQFFRDDTWGNAYVIVWNKLRIVAGW